MRNQLAPLEGQLVIAAGRLAEVRRQQGRVNHMLRNVSAWRWDGRSAVNLDAKPDCTVDHLWCPIPGSEKEPVGMLEKVIITGQVSYYTRADGSVDLAINTRGSLDLDAALATIRRDEKRHRNAARTAQALDELIREIQLYPEVLSFSRTVDSSLAIRRLIRWRDNFNSRTAHAIRSKASQSKNPKNRCRSAGGFRDLLKASA